MRLLLLVALLCGAVPCHAGTIFGVDYPGELQDVSGDGLVAVGVAEAPNGWANPWRIVSGGGIEFLDATPDGSTPMDLLTNLDGSVVWGASSFASDGNVYRWRSSAPTFVRIGFGFAELVAVSDDGETAVATARSMPSTHPALYFGSTKLKIEDPAYPQGGYAVSLSPDGMTMTGRWWSDRAFTYVRGVGLVPEPSSALLVVVAIAALGVRRRG